MSSTYLKFLLEVMAQTVAAPDTQAYLMEGADGDDTLVGDAGNDALFGGADKVLMVGGPGNGSEKVAMKLIAGCADTEKAAGQFYIQKRPCKRSNQIKSGLHISLKVKEPDCKRSRLGISEPSMRTAGTKMKGK